VLFLLDRVEGRHRGASARVAAGSAGSSAHGSAGQPAVEGDV